MSVKKEGFIIAGRKEAETQGKVCCEGGGLVLTQEGWEKEAEREGEDASVAA